MSDIIEENSIEQETNVEPPSARNIVNDSLIKDINHLLDERIWKTKKSRIEAEARLKFNNLISDILINYYTFSVLSFSIWSLILDASSAKAQNVTLMTVILSVGLFGITLLLSALGLKQKANQFKDSHHKLDSLESDLRYLLRTIGFKSEKQVIDEFHIYEKRYNQILELTDNHSNLDFEKVVISRKLKGITFLMELKYHLKVMLKWIFILFMFVFPVILYFLV